MKLLQLKILVLCKLALQTGFKAVRMLRECVAKKVWILIIA